MKSNGSISNNRRGVMTKVMAMICKRFNVKANNGNIE
jgi:hypothetical protein